MAIRQYTASTDTTITNAYKSNLRTTGVSGNMGESDILEVFKIFGQASSGSSELSRILIKFPVDSIVSDRAANLVPTSGNVNFYLRLYNAKHNTTVPKNCTLSILATSGSWDEGTGLDMEEYSDYGVANWVVRSSSSVGGTSSWVSTGGDSYASPAFTQSLNDGTEDILVDVTSLVEQWVTGSKPNHGFLIKLSSSYESAQESYYTKRFFARGTEYFFKRPKIEARWNSAKKDHRGAFYASSSASDSNINTIYLYNIARGQLKNIPAIGTSSIYVKVYADPSSSNVIYPEPCDCDSPITGGWVSTGVYSASFALDTTASQVFDRWFNSSLTTCYHTGAINVIQYDTQEYDVTNNYVISLTNAKPSYTTSETARFRFFIRNKDWNPTIYNVATSEVETLTIESASYKIVRASDNARVIDYGTGSTLHTLMSYDVSGNYFDLDMSMLEPDYKYQIYLSFFDSQTNSWKEQKQSFNFRVVENES
jgi:hypothetical protein